MDLSKNFNEPRPTALQSLLGAQQESFPELDQMVWDLWDGRGTGVVRKHVERHALENQCSQSVMSRVDRCLRHHAPIAHGERAVRRAENLVGLVISAWLLFLHRRQVNWMTFTVLFAYIDVVGYLPGLARVHQKNSPIIEKPFYWAYNSTHTFFSAIPVAALFVWRDRPRLWSGLAVFIHLFGDRGLLGNFTKAVGSEFEHLSNHA